MRLAPKKVLNAAISFILVSGLAVPGFAGERLRSFSVALFQEAGQVQAQLSLAEEYLSRLAKKSKGQKKLAGGVFLALGAVGIAGGTDIMSREDFIFGINRTLGTIMLAWGGICVVGAVASFSFPSPAENAYKRIKPISDFGQRDKACADALARLAKKGQKMRMIQGGLIGVGAFLVAFADTKGDYSYGYLAAAVTVGVGALYNFLVKSPAEKAYQAYLEKKALKPSPSLVFGLAPRKGFRIGLSMDF